MPAIQPAAIRRHGDYTSYFHDADERGDIVTDGEQLGVRYLDGTVCWLCRLDNPDFGFGDGVTDAVIGEGCTTCDGTGHSQSADGELCRMCCGAGYIEPDGDE